MADDNGENEQPRSQNSVAKVVAVSTSSVRGKLSQNRVELVDLISLYAAPSSTPPTVGGSAVLLPSRAADLPVPLKPAKERAPRSKPANPVARPPRAPSTAKLEKDFEKLATAQRAQLLSKWSSQASLPAARSEDAADKTLGDKAGVASPRKAARTDEAELCSLRLQLGSILKQMADLQGKEKRVKLSIKKLQKKVAAKNTVGLVSLDSVDSVLDILFCKPPAKPEMARSRSAPPSSSSAALWSLAQQHQESLALVAAAKVVDEKRYASLEAATAASMEELEASDPVLLRQDQAINESLGEKAGLAATPPATPMPSLLTQLLRGLGGSQAEEPLYVRSTPSHELALADAELCLIRSIALCDENSDVLPAALLAKMVAHQPWDVQQSSVSSWLCKAWLASVEGSCQALSPPVPASAMVAEDDIAVDAGDRGEETQEVMEEMTTVEASSRAHLLSPLHPPSSSTPLDLSQEGGIPEDEEEPYLASGKRSSSLAASPGYFTQTSSKKPRSQNNNSNDGGATAGEDRDVRFTQLEEICLITPKPPVSATDSLFPEVVDLCGVFDLDELPLETEVEEPAAAATALPSSLPQPPAVLARSSSLLQVMRAMDVRYSQPEAACVSAYTETLSQSSTLVFTQTDIVARASDVSGQVSSSQDPLASTRQVGVHGAEPRPKAVRRRSATAGSQPPILSSSSVSFASLSQDALVMATAEPALSPSALRDCLMQNKAMYEKILLFVPIEVDEVQGYLRSCGHRASKALILNLLDSLTIFVGANGKKGRRGSCE